MPYFTRHRSCELYRHQFDSLKARLPNDVWTFFDSVSLHDATLLTLRVGEDIDKRFPTYRSILVNKRHLSAELEVTAADDLPHAPKTVVRAYGFWQRQFGGDARMIGRRMTLDGERYEIIGVAGRGSKMVK